MTTVFIISYKKQNGLIFFSAPYSMPLRNCVKESVLFAS